FHAFWFFFSSRRRHTRSKRDWSSDVCSSDLCWPGSPYQPVTLAEDVEAPVALQIMERSEDFPGITAQALAMREYPYEERAGQILRYLQPVPQEELELREVVRT